MDASIWVAIITSVFSLLGVIITVSWGNKLTLYRIDQLEQKVNKHNNLIERMYAVEKHDAEVDKDIKAIKERINNMHNRY